MTVVSAELLPLPQAKDPTDPNIYADQINGLLNANKSRYAGLEELEGFKTGRVTIPSSWYGGRVLFLGCQKSHPGIKTENGTTKPHPSVAYIDLSGSNPIFSQMQINIPRGPGTYVAVLQ